MIKLFEQYNEYNQIKKWLDEVNIRDYIINDDLTVDVNGDVYLHDYKLAAIPIQFGKVTGYFDIVRNRLNSLKGCPVYVGGNFDCYRNYITSLEWSPKYVGGDFLCNNNLLTNLIGCTTEIKGKFNCSVNNLETLEGCPVKIEGDFFCSSTTITTLEHCPKYIGGTFECENSDLTTLKNGPKYIGGKFITLHTKTLPPLLSTHSVDIMTVTIKNQDDYGIWNSDGTLNKGRFTLLYKDFQEGILK